MTEDEIRMAMGACVVVAERCDKITAETIHAALDAIREMRTRNRELHARLVSQARVLEVAELDRDLYRAVCYGKKKGESA